MTPRYYKELLVLNLDSIQYNIVFSVVQIISLSTATILQQDPYTYSSICVRREYNNNWIMIINQVM